MSEKIEPALTEDEWKERRVELLMAEGLVIHDDGDGLEFVAYPGMREAMARHGRLAKYKIPRGTSQDLSAIIAICNDALPDDDDRKIKIEWVNRLRWAARLLGEKHGFLFEDEEALERMANAVESIVRPVSE